ncbi:lipase family protein [Sphingomonas sp. MMSM20]|uniref:lipase family protein n=1 Tax=Sphingomonas lycopersici TaxID=2951807 RepID=UPI0022387099|nr:lipase family protein [Sphingomonas lycopersici]MCW6529162.1 lipase family protein [Sphingomonas lycopersici]
MLRMLLLAFSLFLAAAMPAQAQRAGALVSADPVREAPAGMQAWKIAYWTTDRDGRAARVTGMVVAPRTAPAQRRVIAWTHGTWGVVERCAPSLSPDFWELTPALAEMIRRGFTVVAPDYPGLGSDTPHPYLVGVDTARSVLDAVRAARSIAGAGVGEAFAVWGESQGGHAALWTAIEARGYAPELRLVGTAAAAPPTDLPANLRSGSDVNIRTMLTAYTAYSWSQRFGHPLSTLFNRTNAGVVTRLARNNCVTLGRKPRIGTILGIMSVRNALKNKDIGRIEPWGRIARANSVTPAAVPGPLLIAQSGGDTVVGSAVTASFARARCRSGAPLRYIVLPGGDHARTARDSATATLDWIGARFAGQKAPSDCGRI